MTAMPRVGDEFEGYRIRSVLGRGGMSVVYEAENSRVGALVALKVMTPEVAADDVFRARFLQESRIAASLDHPNIIPIYDMGAHEDLLFIAMKYVAGSDLRAILRSEDRLEPPRALHLLDQAARAIDSAHRNGLIHRDIKPANMLVQASEDGEPEHLYLADFGISKHAFSRSGLTPTGAFLGTIDYIAPEQIQGPTVDARADLYSLGCVLYECLTGQVPHVKETDPAIIWAHVQEAPPRPSAVNPLLPAAVDEVILRALSKDPATRQKSCRAFLQEAADSLRELSAADSGATVLRPRAGAPAELQPAPGGRWASFSRRTRTGLLAAAVAALVVVGGGAWWAMAGGPDADASSGAAQDLGAAADSSPTVTASRSAGPAALLAGLAKVNATQEGRGLLAKSSCAARTAVAVVCTNPNEFVTEAEFVTYPTLKALYAAYTTQITDWNAGTLPRLNQPDCTARSTEGEISWNHQYRHPRTYTLAQSASGMLDAGSQAGGRVFCRLVGDEEHLVWTQNDGRVLGTAVGAPHGEVFAWWKGVHHTLAMGGMGDMDMDAMSN